MLESLGFFYPSEDAKTSTYHSGMYFQMENEFRAFVYEAGIHHQISGVVEVRDPSWHTQRHGLSTDTDVWHQDCGGFGQDMYLWSSIAPTLVQYERLILPFEVVKFPNKDHQHKRPPLTLCREAKPLVHQADGCPPKKVKKLSEIA